MFYKYKVQGGDFSKAGFASSEVKKILKKLNIDYNLIKRVVVCMYEAEVNIVAHAFYGIIYVTINKDNIFLRFFDDGPGIENVNKAMEEGFSTASPKVREMGFGAGMGLPNIKRNSDELSVISSVGNGTIVDIFFYINNV